MQKAVALAHLRVAAWEPDDDDEEPVVIAVYVPHVPSIGASMNSPTTHVPPEPQSASVQQ